MSSAAPCSAMWKSSVRFLEAMWNSNSDSILQLVQLENAQTIILLPHLGSKKNLWLSMGVQYTPLWLSRVWLNHVRCLL